MRLRLFILLLLFVSVVTAQTKPTLMPSFKPYFQSAVKANVNTAPFLSGVSITGSPLPGNTLTFNYTYNDNQNDTEDSTLITWYSSGSLLQYSGTTYIMQDSDTTNYISAYGTPYASTGIAEGDSVQADSIGPVIDFLDGLAFVEGTDTTQLDSIYASGTALIFALDGYSVSIDSVGTSAVNATAQAYIDAMTDPFTGDTITAFSDMIDSLENDGYLGDMVLFYLLANNSQADALLNILRDSSSYDADVAGTTPTFTRLRYVEDSDGDDYISSNFNPSTAGIPQNAATIGVGIANNVQDANYAFGAGIEFSALIRNGSNVFSMRINSDTYYGESNTNSQGHLAITRTGASATEAIRNGVSLGAGTQASTSPINAELHIIRRQGSGTATGYQYVYFYVMNVGITATQSDDIDEDIEGFLDYIGGGIE